MSYQNNLNSTEFTGAVLIQPSIDGSQPALLTNQGNTFLNENLSVGGQTSLINLQPITAVGVNTDTTLPDSTSDLVVVYCSGSGGNTITLPTPVSGYTLWFQNNATSSNFLQSPSVLIYEYPLGVFNNTNTPLTFATNSSLCCVADGQNWYVLFNSGLYSPFGVDISVLDHLTFNTDTDSLQTDCNLLVRGTLAVTTGPVNFPTGSVPDSCIDNSAIQNGYVDFTSGGQEQLNTISSNVTQLQLYAALINAPNTFSQNQTFQGGLDATGGIILFPNTSIAYQSIISPNDCISNGYTDTTYSIAGEFTNLQNQISSLNAVSSSGNNTFTGTNAFQNTVNLQQQVNFTGGVLFENSVVYGTGTVDFQIPVEFNVATGRVFSSPAGAFLRGGGYINWNGSTGTWISSFNINTATSVLYTSQGGGAVSAACWINLTDNTNCLGVVVANVVAAYTTDSAGQTCLCYWKPTNGPPSSVTSFDLLIQTFNGGSNPSKAPFSFFFMVQ